MRKIFTFLLLAIPFFNAAISQNINEFHYDNAGTDVGEFVEIYIPNPQPGDLFNYTITLYNGSGGASYNSKTLDALSPTCDMDGCYYVWNLPTDGLQNGPPDGIALSGPSGLIEFLSYEGTFTASGGPANGILSTDVGVTETSSTPIGNSLALIDGVWVSGPNTANSVNPVVLVSFSGKHESGKNVLYWTTASETNNSHFEIEKSMDGKYFQALGNVEGSGNSDKFVNYTFEDYSVNQSINYYRLKQVDFDGQYEYSNTIAVLSNLNRDNSIVYINQSRQLYIDEQNTESTVYVFNSNGKLVNTYNIFSSCYINLDNSISGVYIASMVNKFGTHSIKFFIH